MGNARSMGALAAAAVMLFARAAPAGEEASPSSAPGPENPPAGQHSTGKLNDRDEPAGDVPPPGDQRAGEARTDDEPAGRSPPGAPSPGDLRGNEAAPAEPRPVDPGSGQPRAGDMAAVDASPGTPQAGDAQLAGQHSDPFPVHRLGYVAGGGLALTGAAFGFLAQSEAIRAGTLTSARESSATLTQARNHAATANLCFALAGATVLYALALEFLPRPAADAASLSLHF